MERTVITGLGLLSAAEPDDADPWAPFAGRPRRLPPGRLAEVDGAGGDPRLRQADRPSRLALTAAARAAADAGFAGALPAGSGIALGSALGCLATNGEYLQTILARGSRFGNPTLFQNTVPNAAAGYASVVHGLDGPTITVCSGADAGLEAVAFATRAVAAGRAPAMLAGGFEELSAWLGDARRLPSLVGASEHGAALGEPGRGGELAEGACILVLEAEERAVARGARGYAWIAAVARTAGSGSGSAALAAARALERAGIAPSEVGLVVTAAEGDAPVPAAAAASPVPWVGDTTGAGGPFALALAALCLAGRRLPDRELPEPASALVLGGDGAASTAVVLRRWPS